MPDENDIVFERYQIDIVGLFRSAYEGIGGSGFSFDVLTGALYTGWIIFSIISFFIAVLAFVGLIYAYIRDSQAGEIEEEYIKNQEKLYKELYKGNRVNSRWEEIQGHLETDNPNDWKLAIIEADIMLDDMLKDIGYAGSTIGEKLKSASPQNFQTLDDAWRAHRVRNQIAHEGADFILTKKLAQETITQYRRVFQEFGLV